MGPTPVTAAKGSATPNAAPKTTIPLAMSLGALTAFTPLAIDMYLPAFPQIAEDLGQDISAVQISLAIFLAGLSLGQLLFGPLSDRIGRKPPLIAGCLLFALAASACALSTNIVPFCLSRFFMGLGGAAGIVITRAIVRDIYEHKAAVKMFSLMMLVVGLAPILAPLLGSLILKYGEWHSIFWIQSAFAVICMVVAWMDLPESLDKEQRIRGNLGQLFQRYWKLIQDRNFMGYALTVGCVSGILFAYISGAPFFFIELNGVSPQYFSLFFGLGAVGLFGAAQLNHWFLPRYTSRQILLRALTANCILALLLFVLEWAGTGNFATSYILLFFCLASLGLSMPNGTAASLQLYSQSAGTASALLGTLQFAIGSASGISLGLLHNGTGVPMTALIAVFSFLGIGSLVFLTHTRFEDS